MGEVGQILVSRISRFIEKNGMAKSDFAKSIGASNAWLSRLLNSGHVNVELGTLIKIAAVMGITPDELLRDPKADEPDQMLLVVTALAAQKGYDLTPAKRVKKPKSTD